MNDVITQNLVHRSLTSPSLSTSTSILPKYRFADDGRMGLLSHGACRRFGGVISQNLFDVVQTLYDLSSCRTEGGREGLQRRGQTSRGQTNRMTKQGIQDSSIIAAGSLVNKLLVRAGKFRECRRKCSTNHTHPNSPTLEQSFEYCCTRKIKEEKENHQPRGRGRTINNE